MFRVPINRHWGYVFEKVSPLSQKALVLEVVFLSFSAVSASLSLALQRKNMG
jgi:hypothetical protein